MRLSAVGFSSQPPEGEKRVLNSELWHACAGPLVSLPAVGSRVVYFPQGHSEQVAASTSKDVDAHIPNHPRLPPQLFCQLHNVTMHADIETDEVYAQMTLQPLSHEEQKETSPAELGISSKQPTNYFCKTLTASDTSTHGGFSVPRRAAEKVFPPLDFSQQPPAQELIARDLHDYEWKFRHIFRGQPKRHLLTTGWSVFVSAKRLAAGDSVIFIWNEKNELLLGIRRAIRPQSMMPSSVISSDSMHLGLLAAAAHAAATNSPFTIFYNPRACPSEFVIPLAKYIKAVYHTRISVGMRFRMLFETEDSSVRRYMGTITGISDLDACRWKNSHWRSVKVGWDESTAGERQPRVSLWEVEPLTTFPMYPSPFSHRIKRPWPPGFPSLHGINVNNLGIDSPLMWLRGDNGDGGTQSFNFQGIGVPPWMQPRFEAQILGLQNDMHQAMAAAALQEVRTLDPSKLVSNSHMPFQQAPNLYNHSVSLAQPQMLHQSQYQQGFIQSRHEYQNKSQSKSNVEVQTPPNSIQQLLQHQQSSCNQRQEPPLQQQQLGPQQQLVDNSQIATELSQVTRLASHFESQSTSQAIPSLHHQHSFSGSSGNPVTSPMVSPLQSLLSSFPQDESSHQLHLPRANPLISPADWPPSKRAAVEPLLPSGAPVAMPQLHQLVVPQRTFSHNTVTLPPLPGRDCLVDEGGDSTLQNIPFSGQVDASSFLIQNQTSAFMGIGDNENSTSTLHSASHYLGGEGNNFAVSTSMMPSSSIEESGFLQSAQNVEQIDIPTGTFVKVYKSGSFGRSLDISKFSSYQELRSELAHMFGLQGQLEDPVRSGWQLVFVDCENDILLLGDDPWQEFVNSVWCIKILSPQEVQQMGKGRIDPRNSAPVQSLYDSGCDAYASQQSSKNLGTGITAVGSLDC